MKQTVNLDDFRCAFEAVRPENFSYEGQAALFEWFEDYEESTDQEVELDVIAICCDFTEYENLKEFREAYGDEYESLEDIQDATILIDIDGDSFIAQNF